jgi:hypothetical protein
VIFTGRPGSGRRRRGEIEKEGEDGDGRITEVLQLPGVKPAVGKIDRGDAGEGFGLLKANGKPMGGVGGDEAEIAGGSNIVVEQGLADGQAGK